MEEFSSEGFYADAVLEDETPEEAKAAERRTDRLREYNESHR